MTATLIRDDMTSAPAPRAGGAYSDGFPAVEAEVTTNLVLVAH